MSSILRMLSSRSAAVAQSFGARADTYDEHADLQRGVAGRLARLLPQLAAPRVLELGCGTGLFSRHLLARYPDGTFLFTDLAPSMVEQCRRNLAVASEQRASFEIMDAARPTADGPFDLIATSMTLHWLADPAAALATLRKLLTPGGVLIYATISGKSFPEWREVLAAQGLPVGLLEIPELPGVIDEERIVADARHARFPAPHEGGRRFDAARGLRRFAARQASPRHPRRRQEQRGRITWHIVYGRLAASQSRPSISPA